MLQPEYTNKFKKDLKIVQSRNWDIEMLKDVIRSLCEEQPLPQKNKEHFLSGNWSGYKECHIQPDWLLIYQIGNGIIVLIEQVHIAIYFRQLEFSSCLS